MDVISPVTAGGLVLDVAGAVALASALAFKRPQDIRAESGSYWGMGSPYLVIGLARQTADAWVGGTLLVLGFAAQFAGSVGASDWSSLYVMVPLSVAIAAGALAFLQWWLRPWNVRRVIEHQLVALREAGHPNVWKDTIIAFSRARGREIQKGEPPAELAAWMLGRKRWRHLSEGGDVPDDVKEPYTASPG